MATLARARAGDEAAVAELYQRHAPGARRIARALVRDDADDVVADAFTQTLTALRNGRGPRDGFDVYLARAVRHQSFRVWQRRARIQPVDEPEAAPAGDGLDDRVERSVVRDAFRALPSRMRRALWLTEVEGRSHADVATRLHTSPAGVAALTLRARQQLARNYLGAHGERETTADATCAAVRSALATFVRGEAGTRLRAAAADHLESCPECRRERDLLAVVNERLRTAPLAGLLGWTGWRAAVVGWTGRAGLGAATVAGVSSAVIATVGLATIGIVLHDRTSPPVLASPAAPAPNGAETASGSEPSRDGPTPSWTSAARAGSARAVAGAGARVPSPDTTSLVAGTAVAAATAAPTAEAADHEQTPTLDPAVSTAPVPPDPTTGALRPLDPATAPVGSILGGTAASVGTLAEEVGAILDPLGDVVEPAGDVVEPIADVVEPIADVVEPIADVVEPIADVAEPIADVVEPVVDGVVDLVPPVSTVDEAGLPGGSLVGGS